jgi:hypothetical protein
MSLALPSHPNGVPAIRSRIAGRSVTLGRVLFVLVFRLAGFAAVQAVIAAGFALRGAPDPWGAAIAWWPLVAVIAGALTFSLLVWAARREGLRYVDLLSAQRGTVVRDVGWFLLLSIISGPVAYLPTLWLSGALFGDPQAASALMFRPLPPAWAIILFVAFPLSVALTELPAYFGYAMPRLEALAERSETAFLRRHSVSTAIIFPAFFLALQHIALPLLFDWRFMVWRVATFLPFALLLGIALHRRPRLLPYLMIGHFLIDLSSAYFFLALSRG